jgi:hypothetical protein
MGAAFDLLHPFDEDRSRAFCCSACFFGHA